MNFAGGSAAAESHWERKTGKRKTGKRKTGKRKTEFVFACIEFALGYGNFGLSIN